MAATPMTAMMMAIGVAAPAPFPEDDRFATINGRMRAEEKTGPMKPTDCATTSASLSRFSPNCSYSTMFCSTSALLAFGHFALGSGTGPRRTSSGGQAVHPPSGRSNHTWTCPVPTDAS